MKQARHSQLIVEGDPIQDVSDVSVLRGDHYLRRKTGDFTDGRLRSKLAHLATNHLLMLPPEVSGVHVSPGKHHIALRQVANLEKGREKSRALVQFGQLFIDNNPDKPVTELVAAKYLHQITSPRELFASQEVDRRFGAPLTYTPIGFVKRGDGKIGNITRYEHGVVSFDNILWNDHASTEQRVKAMADAAVWMAQLHNHGIIHGDAQAKNITYDSSGQFRYIDLEGASDIHHGTLDTETKRLLDIGNLFDPQTMEIPVEPEEIVTFVDAYTQTQEQTYGKIDPLDIIDTIDSMQEQVPIR